MTGDSGCVSWLVMLWPWLLTSGLCCGFDDDRNESSNGRTNTGAVTALVVIVVVVVEALAVVLVATVGGSLVLEDAWTAWDSGGDLWVSATWFAALGTVVDACVACVVIAPPPPDRGQVVAVAELLRC